MAKYIIDSSTLEGLGDAIRSVTGTTKTYTPEEMIEEVKDILNSTTFILVDADGNEYMASYLDSDTVVTATANDIRKGTTAITSDGLIEGEKEIPAYHTREGAKLIAAGDECKLSGMPDYNFTKLQALFCAYNSSMSESVATNKVSINRSVYSVSSTEVLATVTIDAENEAIVFGIVNDSDSPIVIRYFTYREEY